eukprot:323376_1
MGNDSSSDDDDYDIIYDPDQSRNKNTFVNPFEHRNEMGERQGRQAAGIIVGAVKGIINIADTTVSTVTDHRTYYNCPRCNREVYAYGSFAGNICLDCPGTVVSSIGSTVSMASGTSIPQKMVNCIASPVTQTVTGIGGIIGNVATLQFADNGNGTKACYNGTVIFEISKGSASNDALYASYKSESIRSITSKSCGIAAAVANGSGIDHWWMNIETSASRHYQVQFREHGSVIQVRSCGSVYDCNQNGLKEPNRDENVGHKREGSYSSSNVSNRSLGDLISWLKAGGISSNYSLFNNNCQDLYNNCQDLFFRNIQDFKDKAILNICST